MKRIIKMDDTGLHDITIRSNGQWREIEYKEAEWSDGEEIACFKYRGNYIFLDEIMRTEPDGEFKGYDGIMSWSAFNGILVKLHESGEAVQVYYFYC